MPMTICSSEENGKIVKLVMNEKQDYKKIIISEIGKKDLFFEVDNVTLKLLYDVLNKYSNEKRREVVSSIMDQIKNWRPVI